MRRRIHTGLLVSSTAILAVFALFTQAGAKSDLIAEVLAGGHQNIAIEVAESQGQDAQTHDDRAPAVEDAEVEPAGVKPQKAIDGVIHADGPVGENIVADRLPESDKGKADAVQPYQLIRSLQFVQDSVVRGDHSAMEMQRFLLGVIDDRLRKADQRVFDDPRNVDAALMYAMSGGNPATLDLLALQDRFGNFDNEITTVLRAYLDGRAARTKTSLEEILRIYHNSDIAPYLSLVAANVKAGMNDSGALEMFDWARLGAPGTIIEESALRRSLAIATKSEQLDKAIHYAILYARRFVNSPYAGQFADQLVQLTVEHFQSVGENNLTSVLAFMDRPRQREVYLRIARKAAIFGERELALLAADRAKSLSGADDLAPAALAGLYSGLANISSNEVNEIDAALADLENAAFSPRDAALRQAARLIANEIVREPDPNSLTQAFSPNMNGQSGGRDEPDSSMQGSDTVQTKPEPVKLSSEGMPGEAGTQNEPQMANVEDTQDPEFRAYLKGKSKLISEIDQLLAAESGVTKQ